MSPFKSSIPQKSELQRPAVADNRTFAVQTRGLAMVSRFTSRLALRNVRCRVRGVPNRHSALAQCQILKQRCPVRRRVERRPTHRPGRGCRASHLVKPTAHQRRRASGGISALSAGSEIATEWSNGQVSKPGGLPGSAYSEADSINSAGQVVGSASSRRQRRTGTEWSNGQAHQLGNPAGHFE